jgi:hypothetical protein
MCLLCETARKSRQRLAGVPRPAPRPVHPAAMPLPAASPALRQTKSG